MLVAASPSITIFYVRGPNWREEPYLHLHSTNKLGKRLDLRLCDLRVLLHTTATVPRCDVFANCY